MIWPWAICTALAAIFAVLGLVTLIAPRHVATALSWVADAIDPQETP